jgi:thioredoxin reductase (NADPH)
MLYDLLIIGGGPAGIFASYLAHIKGLKPLLIESNEYLGGQPIALYSQKEIFDYPGYSKIKAYELSQVLINQLKSVPVNVLLSTTLNSYKYKNNKFEVILSNNKKINCKAIVIACGIGAFAPNEIDVNVDKNANIKYIVDDGNNFKNKNVVVLGGGDSAVDWSNELICNIGAKKVSLIHRRDEFRANGDNVNRLKKNKVNIYLDYQVVSVKNKKITIVNNQTKKTIIVPFDVLLVQYGQKIDHSLLKLFKGLKINEQNRIPVGINQMTNLKNIYAIGNICIYEDKPSSIICAHGEAAVAIRSVLNDIKKYDKK